MKVEITKTSRATFKAEDSDKDGMPIGPVTIFRDTAAWEAATGLRPFGAPLPAGVYDIGWQRLDNIIEDCEQHGIELEQL
jgi:hypothetical protein